MNETAKLKLPLMAVSTGLYDADKVELADFTSAVADYGFKEAMQWMGDIIRAVNNHAALVEALEAMMDVYEELHARYDLGECNATLLARAALAAAKGEA